MQEGQELKNKFNQVPNWNVVAVDSNNGRHEFLIRQDDGSFIRVFAKRKRDKQGAYFKLEYQEAT